MDTFWRLFEKSTITTFLITILVVVVCCILWVLQYEVPLLLQTALMLILGYFFGAKGQIELNKYKANQAQSEQGE